MDAKLEAKFCKNRANMVVSAACATEFGDQNHVDKLSDELLLEILTRIESCESAIQCKCVCKRWLNLISCPLFKSQFLVYRHSMNTTKPLPFALILDYKDPERRNKTLVYTGDDPAEYGWDWFSFDFIPHYRTEHGDQFCRDRVAAVCGDLMLFSMLNMRREAEEENGLHDFEFNYLICNPRTKQWVWLPPLLCCSPFWLSSLALVCDPCYSFDAHRGTCCLDDRYRYRVFFLSDLHVGSGLGRRMYVFCSKTGKWGKLVVSCPDGFESFLHRGVPFLEYNGMLHFLRSRHIMAIDPVACEEGSVVSCRLIDLPVAEIQLPRVCHMGSCSGCLRLSLGEQIGHSKFMTVWDLEDYDKGKWCLKYRCSFEDLKVSYHACLCQKFNDVDDIEILRVLGFHPYDMDILYLLFPSCIVTYNMRTKISKAACEINVRTTVIFKRILCASINVGIHAIHLPWWPTPVPALT